MMTKLLNISGVIQARADAPKPTANRLIRLIEEDLQLAKTKRTVASISSQANSITFTFSPSWRKFLYYPATRYPSKELKKSYPVNLAELNNWASSVSFGKICVDQEVGQLEVTYHLNFSEHFRWTLYGFAIMLLFLLGVTALYGDVEINLFAFYGGSLILLTFLAFCGYFGGIAITILAIRSYLKRRIRHSSEEL